MTMSATRRWQVASHLEEGCLEALEGIQAAAAAAETPETELLVWRHCRQVQERYLQWLHEAATAGVPQTADVAALVEDAAVWQTAMHAPLGEAGPAYGWVCRLWQMLAVLERLQGLYQQLAAHTAYPAERLFCKELANGQWLLQRRLTALAQRQYNLLWEELGFSPFALI